MNNIKRRQKIIAFLLTLLMVTGIFQTDIMAAVKKIELAVKYLSQNKFQPAILAFQEEIKIDINNTTAYRGISLAYRMQKKNADSEKTLRNALKQKKTDKKKLNLTLAGVLLDQNKKKEADTIYKALIKSNPRDYENSRAYTTVLLSQGRKTEALAVGMQAARTSATNYRMRAMLAAIYMTIGNQNKAMQEIKTSISINPDQSESYRLLEQINAKDSAALVALGDTYVKEKAVMAGSIIRMLGFFKQGKYQSVIDQYEQNNEVLKNNIKARAILIEAYLKLDKEDKVSETVAGLYSWNIKDPELAADASQACLDAGYKKKAREIAVQGTQLDETTIANYAVLYKSYVGEDPMQARFWQVQAFMSSSLPFNQTKSELAKAQAAYADTPSASVSKSQTGSISGQGLSFRGVSLGMTGDQVMKIRGKIEPYMLGDWNTDTYHTTEAERKKQIGYSVLIYGFGNGAEADDQVVLDTNKKVVSISCESLNGIELGDTPEKVSQVLGKGERIDDLYPLNSSYALRYTVGGEQVYVCIAYSFSSKKVEVVCINIGKPVFFTIGGMGGA